MAFAHSGSAMRRVAFQQSPSGHLGQTGDRALTMESAKTARIEEPAILIISNKLVIAGYAEPLGTLRPRPCRTPGVGRGLALG
jgi:hypothetical protein